MENISTRLKKAMSARNVSQADLVEKTKISKGALSSYISGRYIPKQNNILLLAEALDVSENWLTGADVPMEASLKNIIRKQLDKIQMTTEEVANKTGISLYWLQHIDSFTPGEFGDYEIGYEWVTRIADVIGLPGSTLRTALARQETPASDDFPQITAEEAFGGANTYNPQGIGEPEPLSIAEKEHISKYRSLDPHGKKMVDFTLQEEWERSTANTEPENSAPSPTAQIVPMRFLSYYQKMASAGKGEYLFSDIPTEVIAVPDTPLSRRADFVIGVSGRSMEDTYFDGDKVLVEKTQDVPLGKIGIFIRGDECFIKEAGKNRLISHNEDKEQYPDIIPDDRRIDTIGIVLGKVGD